MVLTTGALELKLVFLLVLCRKVRSCQNHNAKVPSYFGSKYKCAFSHLK